MIAPTENTCGGDDDERLGAPPRPPTPRPGCRALSPPGHAAD